MLAVALNGTVLAASAITGLTAIIVGLIGYLSARLSAEIARRQIEAEGERLREEHGETRRTERRDAYRDLLHYELTRAEEMSETQWHTWFRDFNDKLMDVAMFSPVPVAKAAMRWHVVLSRLWNKVDESDDAFTIAFEREAAAAEAEWQISRLELLDAIRMDTSPDGEPLGWRSAQEVMGELEPSE